MKIKRTAKSTNTLRELAENFDLTLHVLERTDGSVQPNRRFRASFEGCLINVPLLGLQAKHGYGSTEDIAIRNYAANLEGQPLHILNVSPPIITTCPLSLSYP